jgi:archaellin
VPSSIIPSRKKNRRKPIEALAAYVRKSTGSDHLDLSN